ncbi:hypothetical protein EYF80_022554 [Liparis tanakae]|uniref:Uncharacterized protein n=1 Tax=Liparis tanakae TaxID=230148 RepID=A0A4Z2HMY9_9TELE|nr:hypothetical protein EYF80_022554 [Liparis tanakae]
MEHGNLDVQQPTTPPTLQPITHPSQPRSRVLEWVRLGYWGGGGCLMEGCQAKRRRVAAGSSTVLRVAAEREDKQYCGKAVPSGYWQPALWLRGVRQLIRLPRLGQDTTC